jgi:DNA-binding transcriptional regulator GbsR (MarR family)
MTSAKIANNSPGHPEFDEKALRYVEEMGSMFEKWGGVRAMGRIVGLLMMAKRPLNAEEIAHALKISRSGVSTNLHMVQSANLVQVAPRRIHGDRREYYEMSPGSWERAFLQVEEKAKDILKLAQSGLKSANPENVAALARFREMAFLSDFLMEWLAGFEQGWKKHKEQVNSNMHVPD